MIFLAAIQNRRQIFVVHIPCINHIQYVFHLMKGSVVDNAIENIKFSRE